VSQVGEVQSAAKQDRQLADTMNDGKLGSSSLISPKKASHGDGDSARQRCRDGA